MRLTKETILKVVCLAVVAAVAVWCLTLGRGTLNSFLGRMRDLGPVPFFAVFGACISFGVPPTPFLMAAGAAFDAFTNFVGFTLAYTASLAIAYGYAHRLFKRKLDGFIATKAPHLASLLEEHPALISALVRLTPGFPYVLQNCLLASVCRTFKSFVFPSLPLLVCVSLFYASLTKNLLAGKYAGLFIALIPLVGVALAARYLTKRRLARPRS